MTMSVVSVTRYMDEIDAQLARGRAQAEVINRRPHGRRLELHDFTLTLRNGVRAAGTLQVLDDGIWPIHMAAIYRDSANFSILVIAQEKWEPVDFLGMRGLFPMRGHTNWNGWPSDVERPDQPPGGETTVTVTMTIEPDPPKS